MLNYTRCKNTILFSAIEIEIAMLITFDREMILP